MLHRLMAQSVKAKSWLIALLIISVFIIVYSHVIAQDTNYQISSWFTTSSNNLSTGGEYALDSSMGMSVVGQMSGDNFELYNARLAPVSSVPSAFSCNGVIEIPQIECEALVALHNHTDGPNWQEQEGWLQTNTPCSWENVTCDNGRVIELRFLGSQGRPFGLTGNLPVEIGNLSGLNRLQIGHTALNSVPAEIGNLSSLTNLSIHNTQLVTLPVGIGNLTGLIRLLLRDNQLSNVPPEIGNLVNLTDLSFGNNRLTSLPAEIGNLAKLTGLTIHDNQLNSLPDEIGKLTKLTNLALQNSNLSSLPAGIGNLSSLEFLFLYNNQLSSLPPEIGNLSNMKQLLLNNNQLESLPPEIGNLSNMPQLIVNSNRLSTLPIEILNLTNLNMLRTGHNRLDIDDSALSAFLNEKDSTWSDTQTIAPSNLSIIAQPDNMLHLEWTPIVYTADGGFYQISYATDLNGPYTIHGATTDKLSNSYTFAIPNLNRQRAALQGEMTTYYVRVQTHTPAHGEQLNDLWSGHSNIVSATIALEAIATGVPTGTITPPTPTHTATGTPTATFTPTSTSTSTPTPTPTPTSTPTSTSTPTRSIQICDDVNEIPQSECSALLTLYMSTAGPGWYQQEGWLLNNAPCTWYGVFCEEGHVTKLGLATNNLIGSVPAQIKDIPLLKELDLSFNELKSVPAELSNLAELTLLDLTFNQLSELPSAIGDLDNLIALDVDENSLTELPSEIGDLASLVTLDVSSNQLNILPETLGNLATLITLDVSNNQLSVLPSNLSDLVSLEILITNNNRITDLSAVIGTLDNLTTLDLSCNSLSTLPDEIGDLTALTTLNLNQNALTILTPAIGNLTNLTTLVLRKNQLTELPIELGDMPALVFLDASHNLLTYLGDELGKLKNLLTLNVRFNDLTTLPETLGNLTQLEILDAGSNNLKEISSAFDSLTETIIYLDENPDLPTQPTPVPTATPDPGPKSWTLLIYAIGDNNLHQYLSRDDSDGMLYRLNNNGFAQTPNVKMGILFDGNRVGDSKYYTFSEESSLQEVTPLAGTTAELMMDVQTTLTNFLKWGKDNFQSDFYVLSILGHANGAIGMGPDDSSGMGPDDSSEIGLNDNSEIDPDDQEQSILMPSEIRGALENAGLALDILHFDGCSFGLFENTSIADGLADYVIASPSTGWGIFAYGQYRGIANQNNNVAKYAEAITDHYADQLAVQELPYTISIFDMNGYIGLKNDINELGKDLTDYIKDNKDNISTQLSDLREDVQTYDSGDYELNPQDNYIDLGDLIEKLRSEQYLPNLPGRGAVVLDLDRLSTTLEIFVSHSRQGSGEFELKEGIQNQRAARKVIANLDNAHGMGLFYPYSVDSGNLVFESYMNKEIFPNLDTEAEWTWRKFLRAALLDGDSEPEEGQDEVIQTLHSHDSRVYLPVIMR